MAEYYLISQLPSLDGIGDGTPLPITEEAFLALCRRFLKESVIAALESVSLTPALCGALDGPPIVRAWNEGERDLRLALAMARAEKMNKPFDTPKKDLPPPVCRTAAAALETENPLEAEKLLLTHRLRFLETLRPMDGFSVEFLFYYLLKLKLLSRIRGFDGTEGRAAYQRIYSATLSGDRWEVTE